jgi:tetratricopeptide (TPR) repeat protein
VKCSGRSKYTSEALKKALASALFILSTALPLLAQQEVPEIARSLMEDAQRARESGRVDDAIAMYRKVIDAAPYLASAYADLGALYYKAGKTQEAYDVLVRGLEKVPEDRTLLSNAAAAAQQLGKQAEALGFVDRALEKNKRDSGLLSLRATTLRALGRNDEALAALEQAAEISPDDARVQFSLGNQLYATGRRDEAVAAYRKAVTLDKSLLRAQYNLGALLFEQGRYDEALGAYHMALEPIEQQIAKKQKVDVIHAGAFANVGAMYLKQQRYDDAVTAYRKALAIDPKNANAHYNLGFIFFTRNQLDAAVPEYRAALAQSADLPLAYVHLAEIARRKRDYDTAIQTIRDGMSHLDADTKPAAMRTLGLAQLAKGDRASAKASLEQALTKDDVTSRVVLSRLYRAEKRDSKALIDEALTIAPKDNSVLLEAALVARDAGDLARERALLEQLIAVKPEVPLRRELISILLRQTAYDDALRHLDAAPQPDLATMRRALQALKEANAGNRDNAIKQLTGIDDPVSRGDLGLLLWQANREPEAKPHLTAAHTAKPDWFEVTLALGEITNDVDLLSNAMSQCVGQAPSPARTGEAPVLHEALCARAKQDLGYALLSSGRPSRQSIERALSLQLDARSQASAYFLRGVLDLNASNESAAKEAFNKALSLGLSSQAEAAARSNIKAIEEAAAAANQQPEPEPKQPEVTTPRRTAMVFLPDAPVENDKKLAEMMTGMLSQLGLQIEFFRRSDDARSFFSENRNKVGVVVSNPEFVSQLGGDLTARFQFVRNGSTSYRRVVAVANNSPAKSLADLQHKTLSTPDSLSDSAIERTFANVFRTPDDLSAAANALYGKSDAALISEANPMLARGLRGVHTTGALPMPVIAFAPMPEDDRASLESSIRSLGARPPLFTSLASLERERSRPEIKPIEIATVPASALGLRRASEAPKQVPLRVSVEMPPVQIADEMFGTP